MLSGAGSRGRILFGLYPLSQVSSRKVPCGPLSVGPVGLSRKPGQGRSRLIRSPGPCGPGPSERGWILDISPEPCRPVGLSRRPVP